MENSSRRRLTEAETRQRMFDAAARRIHRDGLSATFDQLGFEDIIVEAGVSRSTVYRRWPNRDSFYSDLLRVLVADPIAGGWFRYLPPGTIDGAPAPIGVGPEGLATAEARRALLVELTRERVDEFVRLVAGTPVLRTFSSLRAIVRSSEDGVAAEGEAFLRRGHEEYLRRVCQIWTPVLDQLGFRPVPGVTLLQVATLAVVVLRGYLEFEGLLPPDATHVERCDPFGTGRVADWTIVSRGYVAALLGLLEPVPDPGR